MLLTLKMQGREENDMQGRLLNAFQLLNIVFQAIYSLLFPVGVGAVISYLLTEYADMDSWIWALLLTVGVLIGLVSMVKFILSATQNMDRLEKERAERRAQAIEKERRQSELRSMSRREEKHPDNE